MFTVAQLWVVQTRLEPPLTPQPWGNATRTAEWRGWSQSHLRTSCFLRKPGFLLLTWQWPRAAGLPPPLPCFPSSQKLLSSARLEGVGNNLLVVT